MRRASSLRRAVLSLLGRVDPDRAALDAFRGVRKSRLARRITRTDPRLRETYLRTHPVRKLHLGCGWNPLDGWLNTDLVPASLDVLRLDATRPFPFGDASFDYAYSEHFIEHIPYPEGQRMLAECFRVLKPGGVLRTSTPDLAFLISLYNGRTSALIEEYVQFCAEHATPWAPNHSVAFHINNFVRDWGHQFIYDEATLRLALETAGFVDITTCPIQQSPHAPLRGLEHERRMPPGFVALESMIVEAMKPIPDRDQILG